MAATAIRHVAFIGATGGCTLATVDNALQDAGLKCHALVRTESKLRDQLTERKVDQDLVDSRLDIIQGDAKDVEAVRKVLFPPELNGKPVDVIVSGLGGAHIDPLICDQGTQTVFKALEGLKGKTDIKKPRYCTISTTGLSQIRDLPWAMVPLYWALLGVPKKDKEGMEKQILADAAKPAAERLTSSSVICRPSMLWFGAKSSLDFVRTGYGDDKPAIGYWINKEDVGLWLYHNVIKGDVEGVASITY